MNNPIVQGGMQWVRGAEEGERGAGGGWRLRFWPMRVVGPHHSADAAEAADLKRDDRQGPRPHRQAVRGEPDDLADHHPAPVQTSTARYRDAGLKLVETLGSNPAPQPCRCSTTTAASRCGDAPSATSVAACGEGPPGPRCDGDQHRRVFECAGHRVRNEIQGLVLFSRQRQADRDPDDRLGRLRRCPRSGGPPCSGRRRQSNMGSRFHVQPSKSPINQKVKERGDVPATTWLAPSDLRTCAPRAGVASNPVLSRGGCRTLRAGGQIRGHRYLERTSAG